MKISAILNTSGKGLWSNVKAAVEINRIELSYCDQMDGEYYGQINVYFTKSWSVHKNGLIYTDPKFEREFRAFLVSEGLVTQKQAEGIGYSEQGMQGDNYVNFDFGKDFSKSKLFKLLTSKN